MPGNDVSLYGPVLEAVLWHLEARKESATLEEIDALLPRWGTRPDPALHLPELLKKSDAMADCRNKLIRE